ncbi:type II secretion system protein, partial [bacterium]|nr:type II secretion system protein [bacterium]
MKKGFTLAEVLITLAIIGVVAALTIPTLLANTGARRYATQYKKVMSTLKQALLLGVAHYDLDLASVSATCINGASDKIEDKTICGLFNTTLAGATFIPNEELADYNITYESGDKDSIAVEETIGYMLADGSLFVFDQQEGSCTTATPCYAIIDVNGKTVPNKEVTGVYSTAYNSILMPAAYADNSK